MIRPADPRPTLAQVAARAGVSLKTASRALGGESYVGEKTLARVLTAAAELDYQRNAAASLLASGRLADSIGLITGDFTNPFYSALAQAIEDEIRPHGMHLSVANSRESAEQEQRVAHDLADRQTKAVITVSATPDHADYAQLQARGIPVVFVDRPAANVEADSIVFDNREGGRLAARHLIEAGHRRIAFIGDYEWLPTYRARLAGMGDVLDSAPSEWRDLLRTDAHDIPSSRACMRNLLALTDPPTAVVAGNNRILLGVMEEVAEFPSPSPAVIGFDEPEWAHVLGISVVTGDVEALGRQSAQLAVARLGDRTRSFESIVLPMRLIPRRSTQS
ncbi:LacI family DNA-binding transcriptional regulator [Agreia pratensis]|uniref:LacI family DNA-binding transcriptional regulator n=1 Tax=Microbacteriaceae TaxID=85023 RepID=UPI00188B7D40|nr:MULTISPECIES: LacI family DNA-binding transcriptional regulator [Microbacteriaceae]MBF4561208.1 LacI family DNA-binding transcriptional regulator [Microbacterium sp. VKM Ac-2870]MBF4633904.1 LacI family DNA-binding transcriptional regulator [Agreia pratensis]